MTQEQCQRAPMDTHDKPHTLHTYNQGPCAVFHHVFKELTFRHSVCRHLTALDPRWALWQRLRVFSPLKVHRTWVDDIFIVALGGVAQRVHRVEGPEAKCNRSIGDKASSTHGSAPVSGARCRTDPTGEGLFDRVTSLLWVALSALSRPGSSSFLSRLSTSCSLWPEMPCTVGLRVWKDQSRH